MQREHRVPPRRRDGVKFKASRVDLARNVGVWGASNFDLVYSLSQSQVPALNSLILAHVVNNPSNVHLAELSRTLEAEASIISLEYDLS